MKTEDKGISDETFETIRFPDNDVSKTRLRLFITIIVTGLIGVLVFFDQLLGLWPLGMYWILFILGLGMCGIFVWVLLRWNERHRKDDEKTFLERWGDEIGWPLMILAFTIQFLVPQIRPILLGAILGGSWFLVLWNRQKENS